MMNLVFRIEKELDKFWPLAMLVYILSLVVGAITSLGLVIQVYKWISGVDFTSVVQNPWFLAMATAFWGLGVLAWIYLVLVNYISNTDRVYQDGYSNLGLFNAIPGFFAPVTTIFVIILVISGIGLIWSSLKRKLFGT